MDLSASSLTITLTHGGKSYSLEISSFSGGAEFGECELYQVFVDRYFQGRIYKKGATWYSLDKFRPSPHHPFVFTYKWIQRMGELVESHFKKRS